jgi:hypothetical protein
MALMLWLVLVYYILEKVLLMQQHFCTLNNDQSAKHKLDTLNRIVDGKKSEMVELVLLNDVLLVCKRVAASSKFAAAMSRQSMIFDKFESFSSLSFNRCE